MVTQHKYGTGDLSQQLNEIREQRQLTRRRRYARSRLDRYRAEIEALAEQGASWQEIALWLRKYKRTKVDRTTVGRRLKVWRALAAAADDTPYPSEPG